MAALSDIVDATVSISGQTPARATLNVPLVAGFHTRFPELVRTYTRLEDMENDGFVSTDAEHRVASKIFAQSPTVPKIKVGRLAGAQIARVVTMLAVAFNLGVYSITINGTVYSFTADASATPAEIATGLAALITADLVIPVTATVSVNNLVLTADVAGPDFWIDIADPNLWSSIQDTTAVRTSVSADLAAILAADADWYALLLTRNNHLDAALAAAFVQTRDRIFMVNAINFGAIVTGQDNLASNVTNLLGVLKTANYTRSSGWFTKFDSDHPAAALMGLLLPKVVGSWSAHLKTLAGVKASNLTTTEQTNVEANRGNTYQTIAGIDVTLKGQMAAQRFLDEIVIMDWTKARIKEEVLAAMVFLDKVPFTEAGIAIIESAVMRVLDEGVTNGAFVAGSIYCRSPAVEDISSVDKLARLLSGVEFGGVLAGAIHKVVMRGNLAP